MDSLFMLAGLLGVGDVLLARVWWLERARRRKAERNAGSALRENLRLMDALERRAGLKHPGRPVTVPVDARPRQIREAIAELKTRQASDTGGVA